MHSELRLIRYAGASLDLEQERTICYLKSAKEATLQRSCGALHLPIPLVDICV